MVLCATGTQHVAAQQSVTDQLNISPAPGSSTDDAGTYFVVSSKSGATIRQNLEISSEYNRPIDIRISVVDALTANRGGVAFELADKPVNDMGSWITVERKRLRLASGASTRVPFRVDIPRQTEPGVHLAGLAVELINARTPEKSPGSGGVAIDIESRFVVAVQVDLPGASVAELEISGVEPTVHTRGVTLEVLIENVGFGLTRGEGELELPDEDFEEPLPFGTFVPGTAIRYPVRWERDPAEGEYAARVELRYVEDDPDELTGRAVWEGTFVIGEGDVRELDRLQGDPPAPQGFDWRWLILLGLALLVLALFLLWRRRRSRSDSESESEVGSEPESELEAESDA